MERNTLKKNNKMILSPKGISKQLYFLIYQYQNLSKRDLISQSQFLPFSYISFPTKLNQKIHGNNVDFSSIKIRSKKVHRNDVDISLIEVTLNKVRQNDVDFWLSKLHRKNTSKWRGNLSIFSFSIYRCNINIKPRSIRRGVPLRSHLD